MAANLPPDDGMAASGRELRTIIGVLGIILPLLCLGFTLIMNGGVFLPTISHYYYSSVHGFFTAILCGLGLAMVVYRGYDKWDNIAGNIAAFGAFGVGICPTSQNPLSPPPNPAGFLPISAGLSNNIHNVCACALFVMFFFFSAFLFTRGTNVNQARAEAGEPSTNRAPSGGELMRTISQTYFFLKRPPSETLDPSVVPDPDYEATVKENRLHRFCAWLILLAIIATIVFNLVVRAGAWKPGPTEPWVAGFETVAIWAFALSWLTKNKLRQSAA